MKKDDIPQPFKKYKVTRTYSITQLKKAIQMARFWESSGRYCEDGWHFLHSEEDVIKSLKPRKRS